MEIPITRDAKPAKTDNVRHFVIIDDERGLRHVTAANPGQELINLEGVMYRHSREQGPNGPWVFTKAL